MAIGEVIPEKLTEENVTSRNVTRCIGIDLNYASDFYKIEIQPTILSLEHFIFFGYIKLNNCIKITNKVTKLIIRIPDKIYIYPHELRRTARLLANEFHPLMILTNQKNKHMDVIHLANVLSGIDMKGGELYLISALAHIGNALNYYNFAAMSKTVV